MVTLKNVLLERYLIFCVVVLLILLGVLADFRFAEYWLVILALTEHI